MGKYDFQEIDRELFVTLNRVGDKNPYGNDYVILCDQNFRERFFAKNDEEAIKIFREKLKND